MKAIMAAVVICVLCIAGMADNPGKSCDRWNVFTDSGLVDCDVRETENGFAADWNGIRVETGEEVGAAGVAHRSEVLRLALEYLGGRKVDGVVACGDLTESGTIDELQEFAMIWRSVFPVARSTATTPRAYDYEVQAVLKKALVTRIVSTKRVYSPKCYLAEARDADEVACLFGRFEIPDDHDSITFVVRPLNAWGVFGAEIRSEPAAYDNVRARCWY